MNTKICLLLLFAVSISAARAGDFTRSTSFRTTADFVAAAKAFQPAQSGSDLAKLFTIKEDVYAPATADSVDAAEIVYDGDTQAMVFVTAQPPTQNTLWKVGVLFVLVQSHDRWRISDLRRFDAQNKNADITCQPTSGTETKPIVTITESQGRRDWAYQLSASFTCAAGKLKRLDLE